MNTFPIKAIVITGHYAAGKGDVAKTLLTLLEKDFPLLTCFYETDRAFLNAAVLRDVYDEQAPRPGIEGPHSIIRAVGPPLIFDVKDGSLHHEAHINMVTSILETPKGILRVQEIASGPDVPDFGLYQSGVHLVRLLKQVSATDHALVIDVYAPFSVRLERNERRPDRVSREIMEIAATDGGELSGVQHLLGDHYYQLPNEDNGGLFERVSGVFRDFVRPKLEATIRTLEGKGNMQGWNR